MEVEPEAGRGARVTVALILAALLALAAVVAVAMPFLREPEVKPEEDRLPTSDPAERRRLRLLEERDRALAALSELELDHRTGKITDDDYAKRSPYGTIIAPPGFFDLFYHHSATAVGVPSRTPA